MAVFFDAPDRFVVGAIGAPGERTFLIQIRQDDRLISVVLEKIQVRLLGERLASIVDGVRSLGEADVPDAPIAACDLDPLDAPICQQFQVGDIRIGWDRLGERMVVELVDELTEDSAVVRLTLAQTYEFVARAQHMLASGRPACPLCAHPIEPTGHICPRANGYRAALFS